MRKTVTVLCALTLVFFSFFMLVWTSQAAAEDVIPFSITVTSAEKTEQFHCWQEEDQGFYVFLPSYADETNIHIHPNSAAQQLMIGEQAYEGAGCAPTELVFDTPLTMTYTVEDEPVQQSVTFLRSEGIASIHIDTDSGSMDYIHEDKNNEEQADMRIYTAEGELDYDGRLDSIHGRGNSTWVYYDKKPYGIKLDSKSELLGMPRAKKWVLLANAADPSNIRNKAVFEFAKNAGLAYTPEGRFADLYLNGEYVGLYLLCERNEVSDERIDIESKNGFLVSMELESRLINQEHPYIVTEQNQAMRIHYPSIVTSKAQTALQAAWQSVENAILAEDGIDPVTGKSYTELIDLDSWVRKYLLEELFGNADGCYLSQYFYYDSNDPSGKIFAGPVWDYDLSTGCPSSWQLSNPQTFYSNRLNVMYRHDTPWFHALYQKEEFYSRMVQLYEDEFLPLIEETVENGYPAYSAEIRVAARMNQVRWGLENDIHDTQLAYIQDYMTRRITFLNRVWLDEEPYHIVQADNRKRGNFAHYVVFDGECLENLPTLETDAVDYFDGWYYVSNNQPVDPTQPVHESFKIYAKWKLDPIDLVTHEYVLIPAGIISVGILVSLLILRIRRKPKKIKASAAAESNDSKTDPPNENGSTA